MYLRGDKMSIASVANKKMPRRSNCRQQALLERKQRNLRKQALVLRNYQSNQSNKQDEKPVRILMYVR